jgi:hypothetical protein
VAWILRYHANLRKAAADRAKMTNIATRSPNPEIKPLTVDDMLVAEREIVKYVQGRSFQDELARLNGVNAQNNKATRSLDGPIRKTSPIYNSIRKYGINSYVSEDVWRMLLSQTKANTH